MSDSHALFRRVLIPVANTEDAEATTSALQPYIESIMDTVVAVHVIEKAGGAPDKASVEQRQEVAAEIFDLVREGLADHAVDVTTEIVYGQNVATAIIDAAHEAGATAIVFTPRGGSRWMKLLTGDVTTTLVNESDLPVLVLPDDPREEDI